MSYRILDAETGEIIHGGLTYAEAESFREQCPDPSLFVFEDEEGEGGERNELNKKRGMEGLN